MAKWQPRVSPETEAALRALGPYSVPQGGYLLWEPAPGIAWPWGTASLGFGVHPRGAGDADYRRLIDAWRQACARQATVLEAVRDAVLVSWQEVAAGASRPDAFVLGQVRGAHFALGTGGPGRVSVEAHVSVGWDEAHGVRVDLVGTDDDHYRRSSWSFL